MSVNRVLMEIGMFIASKYVTLAEQKGYLQVARNLRKQGVPFEEAHLILLGVYPRRG